MAIVYDSGNCTGSRAGALTMAINIVTTAEDRILVAGEVESFCGLGSNVTYGGVALTPKDLGTVIGGHTWNFWYMLNPPTGNANLVSDNPACCHNNGFYGMVFSGVNQGNPFGSGPATDQEPGPISIVTQQGWMAFAFIAASSQDNPRVKSIDAPATETCNYDATVGMTGCHGMWGAQGYLAATGGSTDIEYTLTGTTKTAFGYGLRPSVGIRGRAVKYYFNIWDPRPAIKDVQGKVVPPDQLKADAWLEMQGAKLPQSEIYDSFVEDPSKARIVEVGAGSGSANLKASRSQFADVLIKRAAAGRG